MSDKTGENLNIRLPFPLENRLRNIANREGWSLAYTIARYVALGFHVGFRLVKERIKDSKTRIVSTQPLLIQEEAKS